MIRVPVCARVSRVCPGSPRCLFIGTVGLSLSLSSLQFGKLGNLLERAELVFLFSIFSTSPSNTLERV